MLLRKYGAEGAEAIRAHEGLKTKTLANVKKNFNGTKRTIVDKRFTPFNFDNINDLYSVVYPHHDLHTWQIEEQMRMSGYLDPRGTTKTIPTDAAPLREYLVANNSAGKDSIIISPAVGFFLLTRIKCSVILTSASHRQLKTQTEKHIRNFCDNANDKLGVFALDYKDLTIHCHLTGSECILFATDTPGKVEGYHPLEPGRDLIIILNEVKSVQDEIIRAVLRCFGYNYWIEVSSAGLVGTHLHRMVQSADRVYPEVPLPGESFTRTITVDDCPHISESNKNDLIEDCGGIDSPIAQASLYSKFIYLDTVYVIPADLLIYPPPVAGLLGNKLRAGLDLSMGGAEAVLTVYRGNIPVAVEAWRIANEPKLNLRILEAAERHGLRGPETNADASGIGAPIIDRLHEAGFVVNRVRNNEKAFRKVYKNKGTENWWVLRRLIQDKILLLPRDEKLLTQLKLRRYKIDENNVLMVEPKREAASRGEDSPDRADSLVLCFADVDASDVWRQAEKVKSGLKLGKYVVNPETFDEKIREWEPERKRVSIFNRTTAWSGNMMTKLRRKR